MLASSRLLRCQCTAADRENTHDLHESMFMHIRVVIRFKTCSEGIATFSNCEESLQPRAAVRRPEAVGLARI